MSFNKNLLDKYKIEEDRDCISGQILKKCTYCSITDANSNIHTGSHKENICSGCELDLLKQHKQYQLFIEDIIRDIEFLLPAPWKKNICVMEQMNLRKIGVHNVFDGKIKKRSLKRQCVSSRCYAEINASFGTRKIFNIFRVESDIPKGVIAAEIVFFIVFDSLINPAVKKSDNLYLYNRIKNLSYEEIIAIAGWYMIHYLGIMDYKRYIDDYHTELWNTSPKYKEYCLKIAPADVMDVDNPQNPVELNWDRQIYGIKRFIERVVDNTKQNP